MLYDLLLQDTQSKTVELSQEDLDFRFLNQAHVCANRSTDNVTQTFVVIRSGGEDMMSCYREFVGVPEVLACPTEFLDDQVLESHHVVFVGSLVHLGVEEELIGAAVE
jgi:hypothetical protein